MKQRSLKFVFYKVIFSYFEAWNGWRTERSGFEPRPGLLYGFLTLRVPISTQEYKWKLANCLGILTKSLQGVEDMDDLNAMV